MRIYYPSEKLESWLRSNLPTYVTPFNPLGLYNDGDGLGTWLESDDWPEAANGGAPPTVEEVDTFSNPLTDVEKEAMEKAAPAKALIVEDAMAARATLATAREKASGAKDLGEVKEAVQVLAEALDAVLAKMQGEQKK